MEAPRSAMLPLKKALPCRDWLPGFAGGRRTDGVGGEPSRHVTQCRLFVDGILKGAKPGGVPMNRSLTDHRTVMQCTVRYGGLNSVLFGAKLT